VIVHPDIQKLVDAQAGQEVDPESVGLEVLALNCEEDALSINLVNRH